MLELTNPFANEGGVIRLLEPAGGDTEALVDSVLAKRYPRPFVIEDDGARCLYFTRDFIQSEMRLDDPLELAFAYTRKMTAFLLFLPQPREILMLGLGGGSLARWCLHHLPKARVTAVEIDPDVIAFRDQFLLPPDGERFRVVQGDAADHVAQCEGKADVVIIDAFDRHGVAPALCTREFYRDVRAALSRGGVVAANLVGPKAERVAHLEMLRTVFEGNVILLPIADDGNYVAFAFRDPAFEPRWRWMAGEAKALKARHGLDFPRLAARLERSRKLGFLRREMHAPDVQTRRL
jgi:spermidine synthase